MNIKLKRKWKNALFPDKTRINMVNSKAGFPPRQSNERKMVRWYGFGLYEIGLFFYQQRV